jgi:phosphatidylglycerophosphatase A
MRRSAIVWIATGFGAGYVPKAPGLAGSLVGLAWWWALAHLPAWFAGACFGASVPAAIGVAGAAARALGQKDPPRVVIDEIVAVPLALAGATGAWWLPAFVLFRVFDVWKPWPIRQSQALPGGWGIVADDLLAALAACGLTQLAMWAW